ncbi:MAG TPA: nucleotide exchange factor GrpE [Steroidobacteraceae bacterium]|nr:nucleotide exchange factor GrpE [Steroidobacteraceae bacterium]
MSPHPARMGEIDTDRPEATAEDGTPPEAGDPEARIAEAEARAEQSRADFLRALAELDNVRKRTAREIDAARQFGVERFAGDLLPVADSLALALESAGSADAATLAQGQEATLRLLLKAFERAGIEVIDPAGQAFDPERHEAIAVQPAADVAPNTVLKVVQRGWALNGRLLRPARVLVSAEAAEPAAPAAPPDS